MTRGIDEGDNATFRSAAFHPALVRKLVTHEQGQQQQQQQQQGDVGVLDKSTTTTTTTSSSALQATLTPEAADALGEFLKVFVLEARSRASLQAEIEQQVTAAPGNSQNDNDDNEDENHVKEVPVRADHITRIAAEMLMDFS